MSMFISGSATSTGSFGELEVIPGNIRFNGASNKIYTYHLNDANYIDAKNFQANTSSDINFQNAVGIVNITSVGNVVNLKSKGSTPLVASGSNVEFPVANTKISGSSTSTGSFGLGQSETVKHRVLKGWYNDNEIYDLPNGGDQGIRIAKPDPTSGNSSLPIQFTNYFVEIRRSGNTLRLGGYNGSVGIYDTLNTETIATFGRSGLTFSLGSISGITHVSASGNISGSATSTGSFGSAHIADKVGIGNTNPPEKLTVAGDISGSGHLRLSPTKRVIFDQGDSHTYLLESSANVLSAVVGGSSILDITTTKISGSSTSTGSFGSVRVREKYELAEHGDLFTIKDMTNSRTLFSLTTGAVITLGGGFGANINLNTSAGVVIPNGTGLNVQSGNISGSSTSTGSFGSLVVADRVQGNLTIAGSTTSIGQLTVENAAPQVVIKSNDTSDGDATLSLISDNGATNEDYWKIYNEGSDNDLSFKNGNYNPVMTIAHTTGHLTTTGSIISNRVNGVISGSSTSTGSFGSLVIADAVQGDLQINGDAYIKGGGLDLDSNQKITGQKTVNGGTEFTFLKMYDGGDASIQLGAKHSLGYISFQAGNGSYTERMRIKNNGDIAIFNSHLSGSSSSTGSFGHIRAVGNITGSGLRISQGKLTLAGTTSGFGAGDIGMTSGYLVILGGSNGVNINGDSAGQDKNQFQFTAAKISGSSISTGSFGHLLVDGQKVVAPAVTSYTNASDNRILTSVDSETINAEADLVFNGTSMGIGTSSPGTKLDIQGTSSSGTIIQIRDTDDDHPVGVTYNHGTSGHHYSWYAGTMDGASGERKFTIGAEVRDGYDIALTQAAASLFILNQMDKSATFAGNVSSSATSTGSFGVLQLAKYNQGIGDAGSTIFGTEAGKAGMSGTENTAIGSQALTDITSGAGNTAVGREAGANITTGGDNVAIGKLALYTATSPANNVAIGNEALRLTNSGGSNVGVGRESGYSGTTHSGSVYIGEQAGHTVTTGNENIAIGHNAMNGGTVTGDNNLVVGSSAGDALTSGYNNILIGKEAGSNLTTALQNTVIGVNALDAATTGIHSNIVIGDNAMGAATGADLCTVVGSNAAGNGNMTSDADGTVAIGRAALASLTSGNGNTAVGYAALDAEDDGDRNTAIGYQALTNQTGTSGTVGNTALGYGAGDVVTTGVQNVLLGSTTDPHAAGGSNQVVIGYNATGKGDDTVVLGNSSATDIYMSEDAGATVHAGNVSGSATSTGSFGRVVIPGGNAIVGPAAVSQLILKSNTTGNSMVSLLAFYDSGDNERAYIGYGSSGHSDINYYNALGNHDFYAEGNLRVAITNTAITFDTANYKISGSATSTGSFGQLTLPNDNSPSNPTLNFGDGDSGFYQSADDVIRIAIAGTHSYGIDSAAIQGNASNRFAIRLDTPTSTVPNFTPNKTDSNTGVGWSSADKLSLIAGGVSGVEIIPTGVSGSATSTGSFGKIIGANGIETPSLGLGVITNTTDILSIQPAADGTNIISAQDHDGNALFRVRDSSAATLMNLYDGGVEKITLDADLDGGSILTEGNISGSATSTGSFGHGIIAGNLDVGGTLTAQEIHTEFTSASIQFQSGSTKFGDTHDDKHQITGSVDISGSLALKGSDGGTATFDGAGNQVTLNLRPDSSNNNYIVATNNEFSFRPGGTTVMNIESSGEVGIGTQNPSQTLEVAGAALINNGTSNHHLYLGNTSYGIHVVHSTGVMNFVSNDSTRLSISNGGHVNVTSDFLPTSDNTSNLGSSSKRWANVHSADLHLSNEDTKGNEVDGTTGNWTIQEGEDDLYLLNRKNGKKYKFKLEEIK